MDFNYVGYTEDKKLVQGSISSSSEETAAQILASSGVQVLSLKAVASFMPSWEKAFASFFRTKPEEIILFSRELALLLESGIDIVTSLELLSAQSSSRNLKRVLGDAVSDLRSGNRLSAALMKHPSSFPSVYCRALSVGERTGGLETVLRQMADYTEKEIEAKKTVGNALRYPVIVSVVAFLVIILIVTFALPAFTGLYSTLDVELPPTTRLLISITDWFDNYGIYLIGAMVLVAGLGYMYIRTPEGKLLWDKTVIRLPLIGRISLLNELAHCCRSMALLFRAGLPLPEVMTLVIDGSDNRLVKKVLTEVQQDMIKGEGLSRPMAKSGVFLPMMVQMVAVGEETGNLDGTLMAVAQNFETEAADKTRSLIGLIQPTLTLLIGVVVAFVALSLISAMYSVYGQMA